MEPVIRRRQIYYTSATRVNSGSVKILLEREIYGIPVLSAGEYMNIKAFSVKFSNHLANQPDEIVPLCY